MHSDLTVERFMDKVKKAHGCWVWTASVSSAGYGMFRLGPRMRFAHRVSWEIAHGEIPAGHHIDHLCRVRHCVNPAHLEPVTCRENMRRSRLSPADHFEGR